MAKPEPDDLSHYMQACSRLRSQLQAAQAERDAWREKCERVARQIGATLKQSGYKATAATIINAWFSQLRSGIAVRPTILDERNALREALKRVRAINSHRMNRASVQSWEVADAALRAFTPSEGDDE